MAVMQQFVILLFFSYETKGAQYDNRESIQRNMGRCIKINPIDKQVYPVKQQKKRGKFPSFFC